MKQKNENPNVICHPKLLDSVLVWHRGTTKAKHVKRHTDQAVSHYAYSL